MNKLMRLARHLGKLFFLFVLLLLCPFLVEAQVPDLVVRRDSAIKINVVRRGRYSSVFYTINDEPLTNKTLKAVLRSYPKSAAELRKFRAQQRWAYALLPVCAVATIVGGTQSDKQRDSPGSPFSKAPLPFSISVGAFVGAIVLATANNHFAKAIEAYNSRFK